MQALLGTSIVFACFSLSALYAPRGQYLYLGGILMSGLSTLFWLSIMNIFFGSRLIFQVIFTNFTKYFCTYVISISWTTLMSLFVYNMRIDKVFWGKYEHWVDFEELTDFTMTKIVPQVLNR